MFLAVVAFIVIFSLVVLIHELGHFYFARRAGMRVEEFGIGLPPRIWGVKKGDTIYSINWIPFGGFVRVFGEGGDHETNAKSFASKSAGQRIMFIIGGVLMNFVLAYVVLAIGFWLSMPPLVTAPEVYVDNPEAISSKVMVLNVTEGSPAQVAGIQVGDFILSAGEAEFNSTTQLTDFVFDKAGTPVSFTVERGGEIQEIVVTPTAKEEGGAQIGAWIDRSIENVHYPWWKVPLIALEEAWRIIVVVVMAVAGFLYQLFSTASISPDLAGPVGIAKVTADILHLGWLRILQFVAFLSINLGVINLVPFPALDGGRLLFVIIELFRGGRKVPVYVEGIIHTIGFALIILLILVVTYKDILKFI